MIADYDLQVHNSLAVPAKARWFAAVGTVQKLEQALNFAQQQSCPVLPLGGGSNVVFENNYPGLVLHNRFMGINVVQQTVNEVSIEVGTGEDWHALVEHCLQRGWYGLENLALIPGTVGAAPIQNIGAYGAELAQVFDSLTYLPLAQTDKPLQGVTLDKAQCKFAYRDSIFKGALSNQCFITSVRLRLTTQANVHGGDEYPALREWLDDNKLNASPENRFKAVCALRRAKLPDPSDIPNAGSFFKNPVISAKQLAQLQQTYSDMPAYAQESGQHKVAAAWLIEQAGWKGKKSNSTGMHVNQALVLVNPAKASGRRVLEVADKVAAAVQAQFGITLEIEPRIYP